MIMHQSLVLPVMPDETPVGYASRMALKMRCSLSSFCKRTGIPMQMLLDGASGAVASLRHICQLPADTFVKTTYVAMPGRRLVLAGQEFSVDQVTRDTLRICPVCVEQQMAEGRAIHEVWSPREWSLVPLHVCDLHSVRMLSVFDRSIGRQRQDFSSLLQQAASNGRLGAKTIETMTESGLGHHIRRRLRGIEDGHWLSHMPLYAAIKTAEMIGIAAVHGVRQVSTSLSHAERFEAARVGYDILGEGEAGLRELFSKFQRDFYAEASTAGLNSTFGRIYVSMFQVKDVAYDPLRDVLRRHIVETMPFGCGEIVMGQKVTERRVHSARTVAPELGLSAHTAHKRLRSIGVLGADCDELTFNQSTFDARVHANDIRRLTSALPRAEAGRYLGLKTLYKDVEPILDMVGSMNLDKTRVIDQLFAKEDLEAFLSSILSKASSGPMQGFEPVAKASKRARTSIVKILDMILTGEITDVRVSSAHRGVMSVMVRKDDILPAAIARRPWVTLTAGAKAIRMKESTLTALVRNKIIPAEGVSPVMLKPEDLDAFTRTYVSRWQLARQYSRRRGTVRHFSTTKAIADAGLVPAFDERKSVFKFYRRDEVLAALGPPPQ